LAKAPGLISFAAQKRDQLRQGSASQQIAPLEVCLQRTATTRGDPSLDVPHSHFQQFRLVLQLVRNQTIHSKGSLLNPFVRPHGRKVLCKPGLLKQENCRLITVDQVRIASTRAIKPGGIRAIIAGCDSQIRTSCSDTTSATLFSQCFTNYAVVRPESLIRIFFPAFGRHIPEETRPSLE